MNHPIYQILENLDKANIYYKLERTRENSIMICITVISARIEVEIFNDGSVESSVFRGDESIISGIEYVNEIINRNK